MAEQIFEPRQFWFQTCAFNHQSDTQFCGYVIYLSVVSFQPVPFNARHFPKPWSCKAEYDIDAELII